MNNNGPPQEAPSSLDRVWGVLRCEEPWPGGCMGKEGSQGGKGHEGVTVWVTRWRNELLHSSQPAKASKHDASISHRCPFVFPLVLSNNQQKTVRWTPLLTLPQKCQKPATSVVNSVSAATPYPHPTSPEIEPSLVSWGILFIFCSTIQCAVIFISSAVYTRANPFRSIMLGM